MKKEWVKPEMKVITDTKIILECLYEVYQMDGIAIAADRKNNGVSICKDAGKSI